MVVIVVVVVVVVIAVVAAIIIVDVVVNLFFADGFVGVSSMLPTIPTILVTMLPRNHFHKSLFTSHNVDPTTTH